MEILRNIFHNILLGLWFLVGIFSLYMGLVTLMYEPVLVGCVLIGLVLFSLIVFAWMFLAGLPVFFSGLLGRRDYEQEENVRKLEDTCMKLISLSGLIQLAILAVVFLFAKVFGE